MQPQRRRRLHQLTLSLGTIVVLLGLAEVGVRVRQRLRYGTFDGTVHVQEVDAESGLRVAADAARVMAWGYSMALVGTALMRSDDPTGLIKAMREAGVAACS